MLAGRWSQLWAKRVESRRLRPVFLFLGLYLEVFFLSLGREKSAEALYLEFSLNLEVFFIRGFLKFGYNGRRKRSKNPDPQSRFQNELGPSEKVLSTPNKIKSSTFCVEKKLKK